MSRIIVAGAGHGGLVAAMKLAAAGHDVTIYDRQKENEYYLDQIDFFEDASMTYAGIDIPERYRAKKNNQLTFIANGEDTPRLTLPSGEIVSTLTADRKDLHDYLLGLALQNGAKIEYETEITAPVILGSRVAGIKTEKGEIYADLVIDACGVHSPLRRNMPSFTMIENEPSQYELLHTYRAYFHNNKEMHIPETDYNLYLTEDGTVGLMWLVTEDEYTDVLIGRFHKTDYSELAPQMLKIYELNPHMGTELLRAGYFVDIPVRQPLAVFVADGYAAVGDSAFMTYPLKGSGIAFSLRAGTMLANTVLADKNGLYTLETLWGYEKTFFKEIGNTACRLALAEIFLNYLTADEVTQMFKRGFVSTDELASFSKGAFEAIIKSKVFPLIKSKMQFLNDMPELKAKFGALLSNAVTFSTSVETAFPNNYNRADIEKWARKYNDFFKLIRRKDELAPAEK